MNRGYCLLVVGTLLYAPGGAAQQRNGLPLLETRHYEWRVTNRFRLFYRDSDLRSFVSDTTLHTATDSPVRDAEERLANNAEPRQPTPLNETFWERSTRRYTRCVKSQDVDELTRPPVIHTGEGDWKRPWAECGKVGVWVDLVRSPVPYGIEIRLHDPELAGRQCDWRFSHEGFDKPHTQPCDRAFEARVAATPPQTSVELVVGQSGSAERKRLSFRIDELLVLGVGDSYASGDGTPDIPARFEDVGDRRGRPRRQSSKDGYADWLDRKCHRSLLSSQARAAMQLSEEDPRRPVTFLSVACSGAEISHVIGDSYSGVEGPCERGSGPCCTKPANADWSEFDEAREALCKKKPGSRPEDKNDCSEEDLERPIDLVFLTIGGNDAGFGKVIAEVMLEDRLTRALAWIKHARRSPEDSERVIESVLPGRYAALKEALGTQLGVSGERVVVSQYPEALGDELGIPCGTRAHDTALAIIGGGARIDSSESQRTVEHVLGPLNKEIERVAKDYHWTLVSRHVEAMRKHGWCATKGGESLALPRLSESDRTWTPMAPEDFHVHDLRARWLLSPNDSYLLIAQELESGWLDWLDDPFERILFIRKGGAFHPSAMGNAVTADAILTEIRRVLAKGP